MNPSLRILILEDDELIRLGIINVLKASGLSNIIAVKNATDAAKALVAFTPDIAILDISISGENKGFDVAEMLSIKGIPYLFLSGHKDINVLKEAAIKKPLAYLMKPLDSDVLIANILIFQIKKHEELATKKPKEKHILVLKTISGIVKIFEDNIAFVESENVYINIFLRDGRRIVLRSFLDSFLGKIKSQEIIKVHRSFAVNVEAFTKYKSGLIVLNDKEIPVSKTYRANLELLLKSRQG